MATGVESLIRKWTAGTGRLVVLTGAGVSAASGIPTFRGQDGYWTVGSVSYRPQEMATYQSFRRMPEDVWQWYLYRRGVCQAAQPNTAHHALVRMQKLLGSRMLLATQNVDGLHPRAGSAAGPYVEVHGALGRMFCMACQSNPVPIPPHLISAAGQPLTAEQAPQLKCASCRGWMRPHVMWFDESYDDRYFPLDHVFNQIATADLIMTVGTSGGTNLPWLVAEAAEGVKATLVDINPEGSLFLERHERLIELRGGAEQWLPQIVEWMQPAASAKNAKTTDSSTSINRA